MNGDGTANANEIVKALHVLCGFDGKSCSGNCAACPADQFRKQHPSGACDDGTMTAAFALIESLQAQLAASQRRADAAVDELEAEGEALDALKNNGFCDTCTGCHAPHDPNTITWCESWQWRGPQAGEGVTENGG